jgi:protocatechuate 3,4-dioxygenase beta subunit
MSHASNPSRPLVALSLAVLLATPALLAATARPCHAERCQDRTPTGADISLVPPGEPGEPLVITGRVVTLDGRDPLPGLDVYAYHTDAKGLYAPAADPKGEPRLCGVLRSGSRGEYRIRTIMPGAYSGPPHVHLEVWGPGVPRRVLFFNLARRDRPRLLDTLSLRPPGRSAGPSGREAPVWRGADGVWQCTYDIRVDARPAIDPPGPGPGR